jgi:hypothetical protein
VSKKYLLPSEQIKPLAPGHGTCMATDMITVEGLKVGYMYRQDPTVEDDSGWVFTAGFESPQYMDNPANAGIFDVNTIANYDPEIIPFLDAPIGSALARDPDSGRFEPEHWEPPEDKEHRSAITATPPEKKLIEAGAAPIEQMVAAALFCDQCGAPLESGEGAPRYKTRTEGAGYVVTHHTVHMTLCPSCAEEYDGTGNRMVWAMGAFVALVVALAIGSWLLSLAVR